jgi:hypothetical protein
MTDTQIPALATPAATATSPAAPPAGALPTTAVCRTCAASLAHDQRYCLQCGTRVSEPRVAFLDLLTGGAGPAGASAAPAATSPRGWLARQLDRIGGPMGAAAVVVVALGVGYLLGQGGGGNSGPATVIQRSPVVNLNGGVGTPGATATGDPSAASSAPAATTKPSKTKRTGTSTKGIPKAATNDKSGGSLTKLQQQPKDQATQGAAPPKDDKASGGGSSALSIG